jgi:hypothetical protein
MFGLLWQNSVSWQGLKPVIRRTLAARLKLCPDTNRVAQLAAGLKPY